MNIPFDSGSYPTLLKAIPKPPEALNIMGNGTEELFKNCISFVGSRNMSPYGYEVIYAFMKELSSYECSVVSGFSRGVDITCHQASLNYAIPTIAVLPYGLNKIPSYYLTLVNQITQKQGVVVSEYPDDFEPKKWSFVQRNRIIAGMSVATVIIEASLNSGSLITADLAFNYNHRVFAVPGSIFSPLSQGIYHLYKKNALLVTSGRELAELLNLPRKEYASDLSSISCLPSNSALESKIINLLKTYPLDALSIQSVLNNDNAAIQNSLFNLSLKGEVIFKGGLYYVKES